MMKAVTPDQIRSLFATSPKVISANIGRMLRGFGYSNATDELVEAELKAQIEDGAEPCNLSYGLWIQGYLRDGID
ncbi:hypothetical protein LCGC14_0853220 [marine sediment metagenome]|uniref:Uncharacterized protein n=1 Tax=marine sediment metagenome TaxID=412755 RepID=A0A0F9P9P8_9ZZZZ